MKKTHSEQRSIRPTSMDGSRPKYEVDMKRISRNQPAESGTVERKPAPKGQNKI